MSAGERGMTTTASPNRGRELARERSGATATAPSIAGVSAYERRDGDRPAEPRSALRMSDERQTMFAAYGPAVETLAEQAASLVERTVPSARWVVRKGWRCVAFSHPSVGYFCGIFPRPGVAQVGFEFGAALPDPDGLLSGGGAQLRYVMLVPGEPFPERALVALIEAAVALPGDAALRRSMARSAMGK